MAAPASDWLILFRLLLWNRWTEFNKTWQERRSQCPLPIFLFFGLIGKIRWPPWPLIGRDIFDFLSETAERNSTKLDRKEDLNVFYQDCVFWADRKNKMAARASDWLRHFRLLLWNRWTEFDEIWQEARSQCPLSCLCIYLGEGRGGGGGCTNAYMYMYRNTKSTLTTELLDGCLWNLVEMKCSWHRTCIKVFWKAVLTGRLQQQTKCIAMI